MYNRIKSSISRRANIYIFFVTLLIIAPFALSILLSSGTIKKEQILQINKTNASAPVADNIAKVDKAVAPAGKIKANGKMDSGAKSKKLPIPRFATIKFNEVNARSGPSVQHPIDWVFIKKGEPVKIVAEYDNWRKVRDIKGEGGWVHSSSLSGKKTVIITGESEVLLYKFPKKDSKFVAKLSPNVRCALKKHVAPWCKIVCHSLEGWVEDQFLWGI